MKVGILYICVHRKLVEVSGFCRILSKKTFKEILGRNYHIPKQYREIVLKEMVQLNLIEDLGNQANSNIRVLS